MRPFPVRRVVVRVITSMVLFGAFGFTAAPTNAQIVGSVPPGMAPCADVVGRETCLLTVAATDERKVITLMRNFDGPHTVLWIARPTGTGTSSLRRAPGSDSPSTWVSGTGSDRWTAMAVPLQAGETLIAQSPMVVTGGATERFETAGFDGDGAILVRQAARLGVTVAGVVLLEPDADADGWGDDSQDLCPGMEGRACAADGQPALEWTAPEYVPSQQDVVSTWTVTNIGPSTQPFVLDLRAWGPEPQVTGPAGMRCHGPARLAAGLHGTIGDLIVPPRSRSVLAATDGLSKSVYSYDGASKRIGCVLPPLASGARHSGEIRVESGAQKAGRRLHHKLSAHAIYGGGHTPQISKQITHYPAGRAIVALRPGVPKLRAIDRRGRMQVRTTCPGPAIAPGCTLRAEVRAPTGKKQRLATGKWTPSAGDGEHTVLTVTFTKSGKAWLKKRPKGNVRVVVTAQRPGETETVRSLLQRPKHSAAFAKSLRLR